MLNLGSVIVLNDPPAGLDAAAAANIMKFMKKLALAANIAIVCTIHQPSSAVYHGFDRVMLLSGGKVAFLGAAADAVPHFTDAGYPMPPNTNPADFMLDLVNDEFTDPASVEAMLAVWANESAQVDVDASRRAAVTGLPKDYVTGTGIASQVVTLVRRHGLITVRDPTMYIGRMVFFLFAGIFFNIIYVKVGRYSVVWSGLVVKIMW